MNNLNDFIEEKVKQIEEQEKLLTIRILIEDIISAYKGEISWDDYRNERLKHNQEVHNFNNKKIINLKENNYSIEYKPELPILDFATFMVAKHIGNIERGEINVED